MTLLLMLAAFASEKMVYAAGYIPNIQFAPFYVAQARGYYGDEGIELVMDYTIGPDVFKLVALNKAQIGSADADALLQATAREMPLVNVATLYQTYPIAIIARSQIQTPADLRGKTVGISGRFGSSYLGLKAILRERGMDLADIELRTIGFQQVSAMKQGQVDAVVGYVNNEPIRLKALGIDTVLIRPGINSHIPGVGLMTGTRFLNEKPGLVHGFLKATFRGMHDVLQDPETCYRLVVEEYLPQLKDKDRYQVEYRILEATLPFWHSQYVTEHGYGQCQPEFWEQLALQMAKEQADGGLQNWQAHIDRGFTWKPDTKDP